MCVCLPVHEFLKGEFLLTQGCMLLTGLETFLIYINTRQVSAELTTTTQENLMLVGQITAGGKPC